MSFISPSEACVDLANDLSSHPPLDDDLQPQFKMAIASLKSAATHPSHPRTGIVSAMRDLARHFHAVASQDWPPDTALAILLADTTRKVPFWRPLFGVSKKPGPEENGLAVAGKVAPDCVLEVARRILTRPRHASNQEQFRAALRLIANCCADNNVNRSVVIRRKGIETMIERFRTGQDADLLIPTLYNICVDYDDPAVDHQGTSLTLSPPTPDGAQEATSSSISAAEQVLGMAGDLTSGLSSIEILLQTQQGNEAMQDCLGILADLVELASRVGRYGAHHLISSLLPDDGVATIEAKSTGLVRSLLTDGHDLARQDPDCCVSICHALLNVLSQPGCVRAVAGIEGALWKFIHLPYLFPEEESLAPYKKAFLMITYELSGLGTYGDTFNADSQLVRDCISSLESAATASPSNATDPCASMCVLIANAISSTERTCRLVQSTPVASMIGSLIINSTDNDILLPTVDIATRLSLCREGQDALRQTEMMLHLDRHLRPGNELDKMGAEIQRRILTAIRLLIKGRSKSISDLAFRESFLGESAMETVMNLFSATADSQTKFEISRLSIEVVRTLFACAEQLASGDGNTTRKSQRLNEGENLHIKTAELHVRALFNLPATPPGKQFLTSPHRITLADTISWLITQSPSLPREEAQSSISSTSAQTLSPQAPSEREGEAWFGLALLSALPSAMRWMLKAFAQNDMELVRRLQDIVSWSSTRNETNVEPQPDLMAGRASELAAKLTLDVEGASSTRSQNLDPRYENIKVLVVNLLQQSRSSTAEQSQDGQIDEGTAIVKVHPISLPEVNHDLDAADKTDGTKPPATDPSICDRDVAVDNKAIILNALRAAAVAMGLQPGRPSNRWQR